MPAGQGRRSALRVALTDCEREAYRAWMALPTTSRHEVPRVQLILLLSEGQTITAAARACGLERRHAYKWIARWLASGLGGLEDQRRWNVPAIARVMHDANQAWLAEPEEESP